jgi:hypothetical protein
MQDFDSLKNMWQQSAAKEAKLPELVDINNHSKTIKMKLQKPQLHGAIMLTFTAILVICLAIFGNLNFKHWYTYGAMALISLICLTQAAFMYATYQKIKSIDDMAAPAAHLQQWEAYYDLRKKQNKWNMPIYYTLLNIAMAIYLIEIFTGRPIMNVIIFVSVYIFWMLFAYFYLTRKNIARENNRLQRVIDELKTIERQLNKQE